MQSTPIRQAGLTLLETLIMLLGVGVLGALAALGLERLGKGAETEASLRDPFCQEVLRESCAAVIEVTVFEAKSGQWLGLTRTEIAFGSMPDRFVIDQRSGAGDLWVSRPVPRIEKMGVTDALAVNLHGESVQEREVVLEKNKPLEVDAGKYIYRVSLSARTSAK